MTCFLKYVASRLFFGTFVAVFAVYGVLIWIHEVLYAGRGIEDYRFIIWTYLVVLVAVSALMSLWGHWRFNRMLAVELARLRREYHPRLLIRAYRRLINYLEGCWFFNTSRIKHSRQVAGRFGEILLGMEIEDEEALGIYEEILLQEPEKDKFYDFLIRCYSRKGRLSERSFNFLRRRYHERPDDRLVGILSREYTLRRKLNYESERVLLRCLKLYPRHRDKVLCFVVPRLLAYSRTDDNAAMFYMAAAEEGQGEQLAPILRRLEERYREKGRDDALAYRLAQVLHDYKIPEKDGSGEKASFAAEESSAGWEPDEEEEGVFRLEGLDYGEESLERQAEEKAASQAAMSLDSRFHALKQRLFAEDRATVGRPGKWAVALIVIILLAVGAWYARPLLQRAKTAVGGRLQPELPVKERVGAQEKEMPALARFTIQVGAFSDSSRAADVIKRLKTRGVESYLVPPAAGERRIFKVRVGAFASDSSAAREARSLQRERLIQEWTVVPYESRGR